MDERALLQSIVAKSQEIPVLVDFWAPWCQPCKQLTPTLERLAAEAGGAWELVKVNVDEAQGLAAQFGIQSIPNCKLLHEGRLLGEFSGGLPETEIRSFLDKHLPKPEPAELDQLKELAAAGHLAEAQRGLAALLLREPDNIEAKVLTAQVRIFEDPAQTRILLEQLGEQPEFSQQLNALNDLVGLLLTDDASLPDGPVRQDYQKGLTALRNQAFEAALDAFFDVLIRDRGYQDEGARRGFVAVFEYLGRRHPISKKYARRFEMAIFA